MPCNAPVLLSCKPVIHFVPHLPLFVARNIISNAENIKFLLSTAQILTVKSELKLKIISNKFMSWFEADCKYFKF